MISCKRKEENLLIGDWYFDKIVDYDSTIIKKPKLNLETTYGNYYNFNILNDSVLNLKGGFYHSINYNSSYYLGTRTNYKIKGSSIVYFDKSENDWDTIKIKKIKRDTLVVIGYDEASYQLIKKQNTYFSTENYDAIVIYRSPCYGSCPFNSTYIDRKGNFYFKGYDYNTQNGKFSSKLDKEATVKLFNYFDKINISKLEDKYFYGATCSQTNVVSFIKNGKIVKTIESYIACPIDLKVAITKLSYGYQQVKLNHDYDDNFIFYKAVTFNSFNSKNIKYRLLDSESFFLEKEIFNGKKVNSNFSEKFELRFYEIAKDEQKSDIKKIVSDGRFFKFIKKDKTFFVIDIGYNFIERNPIIKTNREY